jgi:ABC-type branched-subunit amino acid transport system substrate-binding protein
MTLQPRRRVSRIAIALAVASLAAACGNRVSHERVQAASYLDGTRQETVAGDQSTAVGSVDQSAAVAASGDPGATAGPAPGGTGGSTATSVATGRTGGAVATAGPAAGGTAGQKATGSEVSIGVLGTFSGPVGVYVKDFATAIQVWGRWVNDNGGLNGHRVRVVVGEDGGSPAGFNSRAQQMVEQEHVLAFAFTTLGLAPQGNNAYLDSAKVLTFGTENGTNIPYQDPFVLTAFPSGDLYADAMFHGFASVVKARGVTKVASLACSDFSLCDNFDRRWTSPDLGQATGLQTVYRGRPSLTTPDFTSICIDARNAGAQAIINGMDTASVNRLADSCARQGYHPIIGLADLLGRPEFANNPNADGGVVGTKHAAWFDTRVPGIVEFQQAFAKYAPNLSLNGTLAGGWFAARFLQEAARGLPANPTAADFIAGLGHLDGTTLGGVTYPLRFTPGQPSPKKLCYSAAMVKNKTFVPGPGKPLECV